VDNQRKETERWGGEGDRMKEKRKKMNLKIQRIIPLSPCLYLFIFSLSGSSGTLEAL
jgi:hypothetical protein